MRGDGQPYVTYGRTHELRHCTECHNQFFGLYDVCVECWRRENGQITVRIGSERDCPKSKAAAARMENKKLQSIPDREASEVGSEDRESGEWNSDTGGDHDGESSEGIEFKGGRYMRASDDEDQEMSYGSGESSEEEEQDDEEEGPIIVSSGSEDECSTPYDW